MNCLRDRVRKRLLEDMLGKLNDDDKDVWKVMIVDKSALMIISAACRVKDIIQQNVTVVENLDLARQPFPQMDAIYLLSPTMESVDKMLKDFNGKTRMYRFSHVFFTNRVSKEIMEKLKANPKAIKSIKTLCELNLDFLAVERSVFHLNQPDDMLCIYGASTDARMKKSVAHLIVSQLMTFCISTAQAPYVRYFKNPTNDIAQIVAESLSDKVDQLAKKSRGITRDSVILIVDRSVDTLAPILHEFTYQAMAYDLADIKVDNVYEYKTKDADSKEEKVKKCILDEYDDMWIKYRHTHIADMRIDISKAFTQFLEEHKDLTGRDDSMREKAKKDTKNISALIHKLPQYQETVNRFSTHLTLSKELMDKFRARQLERLATWEQNMAMNLDQDGKELKNVLSSISPILADESISAEDKVRLVMIYLVTQGGIKDDKKPKLFNLAKLNQEEERIINNLAYLGVQLTKENRSVLASIFGKSSSKKKSKDDDVSYTLSRYAPKIKEVADQLLKNTLKAEDYPWVQAPPSSFNLTERPKSSKGDRGSTRGSEKGDKSTATSLRSKAGEKDGKSLRSRGASDKPAWMAKKDGDDGASSAASSDTDRELNGKKLYIFVIGGMTHSEIRSAYELENEYGVECVIGSTSILTPREFLGKLETLKSTA